MTVSSQCDTEPSFFPEHGCNARLYFWLVFINNNSQHRIISYRDTPVSQWANQGQNKRLSPLVPVSPVMWCLFLSLLFAFLSDGWQTWLALDTHRLIHTDWYTLVDTHRLIHTDWYTQVDTHQLIHSGWYIQVDTHRLIHTDCVILVQMIFKPLPCFPYCLITLT